MDAFFPELFVFFRSFTSKIVLRRHTVVGKNDVMTHITKLDEKNNTRLTISFVLVNTHPKALYSKYFYDICMHNIFIFTNYFQSKKTKKMVDKVEQLLIDTRLTGVK